jgi:hypothetical protein
MTVPTSKFRIAPFFDIYFTVNLQTNNVSAKINVVVIVDDYYDNEINST